MTDEPPDYPGMNLWVNQLPFYASVGEAISLWASMEGRLVQIAAKLLGTTDQKAGLVLYSIANFFAWLGIIEELFILETKYADRKAAWGIASDRLRSLNDVRVRLAHHTIWDYPEEDELFLRPAQFDLRSKSRKYRPLSRDEIEAFTKSVGDIEDDLIEILIKMRKLDNPPP
jgi:hypothetical protein